MTWASALNTARNSRLGGYDDWRVPNVKELQSLVKYTAISPSIDTSVFPNTPNGWFWTASHYFNCSNCSWIVSFDYGYVGNNHYKAVFVRCVRAGQLLFLFSLNKSGTGTGSVISNPSGINCGSTCSANFAKDSTVTLTATAAADSTFGGWSGACSSSTNNTCTVTMDADKTATASFNLGPAAPVASSSAASNITQTSAQLNGSVASSGATATASFDFGTTTNYGQNITAVPNSIYSNSAVAVMANKTGLTCNQTYHFRTKAVNSVGTSYGVDQTFTTAACPSAVNSWLYPATPTVVVDKEFTLDIHANSNGVKLGSYDFVINFDSNRMVVDTTYQNIDGTCEQGVCPGANALSARSTVVNNSTGVIKVAAFEAEGIGPGNDLQVLVIHFKAKITAGPTLVDLTTRALATVLGESIGLGAGDANVTISTGLCGDTDGNAQVNIIDALAVARHVIDLPPPPTVNEDWADVNRDMLVNIVDAMHIARHSVGLLVVGTCAIGGSL